MNSPGAAIATVHRQHSGHLQNGNLPPVNNRYRSPPPLTLEPAVLLPVSMHCTVWVSSYGSHGRAYLSARAPGLALLGVVPSGFTRVVAGILSAALSRGSASCVWCIRSSVDSRPFSPLGSCASCCSEHGCVNICEVSLSIFREVCTCFYFLKTAI